MDVSGRIPRTWMPAIHAGMTEINPLMYPLFVDSTLERGIFKAL